MAFLEVGVPVEVLRPAPCCVGRVGVIDGRHSHDGRSLHVCFIDEQSDPWNHYYYGYQLKPLSAEEYALALLAH